MQICLVGYLDNTPENRKMLDTYELRNDFWAENFAFRRLPYEEWKLRMLAVPGRPNNMITDELESTNMPKQLELDFKD